MTNVSVVEKISELMQQIEVNSPLIAALHYCLSEAARHIAELEQKLAESQCEFRAADATIENLQVRAAELAAENAWLKRFPDQIVSFIGKLGSSEIGRDTKEKIEVAANKVQTPATDAFLAEVRAQGVEMFASSLGSPYVERGEECYQDGYTHAIERIKCRKAPEFADQLRKGVQS